MYDLIQKELEGLEELEGKAQLIKTTLGVNDSGKLEKFDTNSAYAIYNEIFAPIENFLGNASEMSDHRRRTGGSDH